MQLMDDPFVHLNSNYYITGLEKKLLGIPNEECKKDVMKQKVVKPAKPTISDPIIDE